MGEKPNYYAIIPANVRYDSRLTPNAKLLYGEITALAQKDGICWATNKYFAELYNVSQKTISNQINYLVEYGYIESTIKYKDGTKEIVGRYIKILGEGYGKKIGYPMEKNVNKNNTSTNNTSINNNKEIYKESICLIIDYLNSKANTRYTYNNKKYNELIMARLKDGFKLEDFQYVIDVKADEWLNDPKMSAYLKPTTLFAPSHFEDYLNQKPKENSKNKVSNMLKELYEREVNDKRGND